MTTQAIEFLKRTVQQQTKEVEQQQQLGILNGLPFYCQWLKDEIVHPDEPCCFNHAVRLPRCLGQEKPLFEYERTLFNTLMNHKMVYLLKATGIGATEFMIRYISWLCTKDGAYSDKRHSG